MFIKGNQIIDEWGRCLILRGCNLGGSSKVPASPAEAAGQGPLSLANPGSVSFTGRPFPAEEAEIHFKRLKGWGFTFLRFIVTWEALEHAGPGIYDEEYLAYLRKILLAAEKQGISVFIDPHQDVWSRWTGGDGAPAWTLEKIGIDLEKLDSTGAAVTIQHLNELPECADYIKKDGRPKFFWPINYYRYAASTMFTLFYGGQTYAPAFGLEGKNAQDWLQEHYIAAFRHCYKRLKNCTAIAGWGIMNEPNPGFIGRWDLSTTENCFLPLGPTPSPWESMLAVSGEAVRVQSLSPGIGKPAKTGSVIINPNSDKLFKKGFNCPWKIAGVWSDEDGNKQLLKKDHFALFNGKPADFTEDFLKPFLIKFITRMKEADRPSIFFIEGIPQGAHPSWSVSDCKDAVNAFHYYDPITVFTKRFIPNLYVDLDKGKISLGKKKAAAGYAAKLAEAGNWAKSKMDGIPCLLGEFGLPFDLNNRKAFSTGDYSAQEEAFSRYYDGVDMELLHSTVWNYTAVNTNDSGDHWNAEDFSIYSQGEGRAMKGWLRPYPMATAGTPLEIKWDRKKLVFSYRFTANPEIKAPTEIYIPPYFTGTPVITIKLAGAFAAGATAADTAADSANTDAANADDTTEKNNGIKTEYNSEEQRLFIFSEGSEGIIEAEIKFQGTREKSPD